MKPQLCEIVIVLMVMSHYEICEVVGCNVMILKDVHGQLWLTMVIDVDYVCSWLLWLTMVEYGWICLFMVNHG